MQLAPRANMLAPSSHFGLYLLALGLIGCTNSTASEPSCTVRFGGNTPDSAKLTGACASLQSAGAAGSRDGLVLDLQANTEAISQLSVSIDLGTEPAPGVYSSETDGAWNAIGAFEGKPECEFRAGDDLVPSGSYLLTIDSIDAAEGGEVHGTLELTAYVHAPPTTDCGAGDSEAAVLEF